PAPAGRDLAGCPRRARRRIRREGLNPPAHEIYSGPPANAGYSWCTADPMPDRSAQNAVAKMAINRSDLPARDDTALATALRARDRGAAVQAWVRFSPLVLGVLRRFFGPGPGGNSADRQDLCQEVFLRFFARIDELRDPGALRGFLMGIALGVAQNELRRI